MRFDEIGRVYPSIRRLPALYEMAAVAQALYNLQDVNAELGYWLNEYVVPTIATPRAVSAAGSARLSQSEMRLQRAIRIVRDAGVHERPDDDPPSEAAEAIEIAGDLLVDAWVLYGVEPHDAITRVKGVPTDIGRLDDLLGQKLEDLSRSIRIWNESLTRSPSVRPDPLQFVPRNADFIAVVDFQRLAGWPGLLDLFHDWISAETLTGITRDVAEIFREQKVDRNEIVDRVCLFGRLRDASKAPDMALIAGTKIPWDRLRELLRTLGGLDVRDAEIVGGPALIVGGVSLFSPRPGLMPWGQPNSRA